MNGALGILREILHLFVDDGSLAVALVLWSAAAFWLLPGLPVNAGWDAVILLLGYLAILGENLRRSTRRR
jgi:hypothetical protein